MIEDIRHHDHLEAELAELKCTLPGIPSADVAELLAIDGLGLQQDAGKPPRSVVADPS